MLFACFITVQFSRIIQEIIECQKVMVGHNCFSDLVRIYQNFIDDLPLKYQEFKKCLHIAFPEVYDTKHVAWIAKKLVRNSELDEHTENMFWSTSLNELYKNISSDDSSAWINFHVSKIRESLFTFWHSSTYSINLTIFFFKNVI